MLISTGRIPSSEPWHILEVAMNQAPDVLALRIGKELKRLHEPAEALVPFTPNACGLAEWIIPHVYVRGLTGSLSRIASTAGIDFTRSEIAPIEWIQKLVIEEQSVRPKLRKGAFVRITAGPCARMCGTITKHRAERLTVTILLRTKTVNVHTSSKNVQVVQCPASEKSFFFSQI